MVRRMQKTKKERGVALIITLIVLLVLSVLIAALIFVTNTEVWASANYKLLTQARYTAEAGAQASQNWLIYNYVSPASFASYTVTTNPVRYNGQPVVLSAVPGVNSNYPDPAVVAAYTAAMSNQALPGVPNASYSTYATLLSMTPGASVSWLGGAGGGVMQTWQITSQGSIGGVRNAKVQVVETIQRGGAPLFNYAVETISNGCSSMNFQGKDGTDSYNSSLGPYGGTNVQASGGNVASNGNVSLGSGTTIDGTISVPNPTVGACPDGITNNKGTYLGTSTLNPGLNPPLPWGCTGQPCYPSPLPPTTPQDVSTSCATVAGCTSSGTVSIIDGGKTTTANVFTLAPGSYGNITLDSADVIHLSAGTYNVNSMNFAKDGQIVVDSGPVVFNIAGQGIGGGGGGEGGGGGGGYALFAAGYAGFNMCSGGVTGNPDVYGKATCGSSSTPVSGIPANLQIVYGGTAGIRVGGLPDCGVIYAPASPFLMPGAPVGFFGSILSSTFTDSSSSPFHYDSSLSSSITQVGAYHVVGFSWSKF